jgi:YD repeat-containing protein
VDFENTDGRVKAISGPDTTAVRFDYADATPRITARRDRRHVWTHFGYDAGSRLSSAAVATGPGANDRIPFSYLAQESRGITQVPADQVHTLFDGPRPDSDVVDVTRVWVDRRGMPFQLSDALGSVTRIHREDPASPGLPTRVRYQNGREVTSAYDAAGRVTASTDWSRSSNGRFATTLYEWDARCGAVKRTTLPEGEVSLNGYDARCLPEWAQVGQDSARRMRVAYWPATDTRAPSQMRSVTAPLGGVERYEYDTRGNLSASVTGMGFRSEFLNDLTGRLLRTKTPVDSAQTVFRVDTLT